MKSEEKQRALALRSQGWSYNQILAEVGVSKSTLSLWLREVPLTDEQIAALKCRFSAGREKFAIGMRRHRDARWAEFHREAAEEYKSLSQDPTFMFGLALYIGEGSKTKENALCIANCDPRVIQKGLEFFLRIGVPYESLRCGINLHPGLCQETAKQYWQEVTGLPQTQFYRISEAVSRASSGRKGNIQVYGTCQITASHTKIRQKLSCWMTLALTARSFIG